MERLRELLAGRRDELAASLRRIEAHLDAIDRGGLVEHPLDIVVKHTDPMRVAAATLRAPGYGHENINPLFESLVHWIEANGYELAWYTRELYWHLDMDPSKQVTEIQIPLRAKREEACPSPT